MQNYMDFTELPIIYRGDDEATMMPYGGVAVFRDGRFVLASHYRGRLAMVGADGMVISTCDPLNKHINYDKLICYGIALHDTEQYLYMLVGEEKSTELYILTVEIIPSLPVAKSVKNDDTTLPDYHYNQDDAMYYTNSTFRWIPSSDIRLPSTAARNGNYTDCGTVNIYSYPELHGKTEDGEYVVIPWDIKEQKPKGGIPSGFIPEKWEWKPMDINTWGRGYWTIIEKLNNPSLGPIIIDYPTCRPCMTSVGSRVMVGCTHAQTYYINKELIIPYQDLSLSLLPDVEPGELRKRFFEWLMYEASLAGLNLLGIDDLDVGIPQAIGPQTGLHWQDVLKEGPDGVWWVEEGPRIIHFKLTYQDARPTSSIVTIHPDIGTHDGLFNLTFNYPIQHMFSEYGDVTLFLKDTTVEIETTAFKMLGAHSFFSMSEFEEDYAANPNPTPIDMNFYLRQIQSWLPTLKQYLSTINPLTAAADRVYKSNMTWEDTLVSGYITEDEALLSVHAPTFD